jgi:integrase
VAKRQRGNGEGSIAQRADGRWMARVSLGGYGKTRRVDTLYGATRDEVAKALTKALRDKDTGKTLGRKAPKLSTFAETWMTSAADALKPSTCSFYRDHLDHHVVPLLGRHRIDSIRRQHVVALIRTSRQKDLKVNTVRGIVRTLSAVLSEAVEQEYLDANPALNVRKHLRQGSEAVPEPDPFTAEDAHLFAETSRQSFARWYPLVLCGLRTGMRLGELLGLEWGDVDWRARTIRVSRSYVRGRLGSPKNHQRRTVDLSPQLRGVLRLYRRQLRATFLADGLPRPEILFPSDEGTRLDDSNVRKVFTRICEQAQLAHRSPHDMRHTYASLLLSAGAPLLYVSAQLGHTNSTITLKTYAQWMPKTDARAHSAMLDDTRKIA